jgi:hypothetical protein
MSGFERPTDGSAWTDAEDTGFPDDFSGDEANFASVLRDVFEVERDDPPPLYARTLLDDERLTLADPLFEQRTAYRVFRQLRLRRSVLPRPPRHQTPRAIWSSARETLAAASRPVVTAFGVLLALMALTVVLASPSFAAGLNLLLGHTGVAQVPSYPNNVRASHVAEKPAANLDFDPAMPLRWLGHSLAGYRYAGVQLQDPADWSKGPIVELQYSLAQASRGTGVIDIREFQINPDFAAVLQVVKAGSASEVSVGGLKAVYVNGAWVTRAVHQADAPTMRATVTLWQSGVRSELILERDNVVYWIVADQRDGLGRDALIKLAARLIPVDSRDLLPNRVALRLAGDTLSASFRRPVGKEVYELVPAGVSPETGVGQFVAAQS